MSQGVVLVTGGSRGLGLALVEDCLAHGWRVATMSRSGSSRMAELAARHEERFFFTTADLTDREAPERVLGEVKARFGRLDCVVNNAAIADEGPLATFPVPSIERLVDANLTSVLVFSRAVVREFLRAPRANPKTLITISSVVAESGFRGLSVYAATKSALLGMTRSLARELGPVNVTVNAVLPGFLITDMSDGLSDSQRGQIVRRTPLGRLGDAADVTPVIRFLMGPEGRFITGQCIVVDGGASC